MGFILRSRNVKPGLFSNESVAECSPEARYAFIGLWCVADCYGRLENRPKKLKMLIMPADSVKMEELILELVEHGLVSVYGPNDKYIWVNGFTENQNPHPDEKRAGSKLPPHPDDKFRWPQDKTNLPTTCQQPSPNLVLGYEQAMNRADSLILDPDSLIPNTPLPPKGELPIDESGTGKTKSADYSPILEVWKERCIPAGLPGITKVTEKRKSSLRARASDSEWMEILPEAIDALLDSDWHMGREGKWKADLDWFLRPDSAFKLVEKYRAKTKTDKPMTWEDREQEKALGEFRRSIFG